VSEQGEEETPHHPLHREDDQRDAHDHHVDFYSECRGGHRDHRDAHDHHADFYSECRGGHREHRDAHRHSGGPSNQYPEITVPNFFQLPHVLVAPRKQNRAEPLVDYTKSIIMTGDDNIRAMEEKASQKEAAEKEKQSCRHEAELTKVKRTEEKAQLAVQKSKRQSDGATRTAFKQRWSTAAMAKAGNSLHQLIKSGVPPLPSSYIGQGCLNGHPTVKFTVRTSFSSRRPRASALTPLTRFYPRTVFTVRAGKNLSTRTHSFPPFPSSFPADAVSCPRGHGRGCSKNKLIIN
jgi:hypothetical protein